jgi:hypothetical protein
LRFGFPMLALAPLVVAGSIGSSSFPKMRVNSPSDLFGGSAFAT